MTYLIVYLVIATITWPIAFIACGVVDYLENKDASRKDFIAGAMMLASLCAVAWPFAFIIGGWSFCAWVLQKSYIKLITTIGDIVKGVM